MRIGEALVACLFLRAAQPRPRSSHVSIPSEGIALKVSETAGITRREYPLTRGVPLPQGAVLQASHLSLQDAQGRDVPVQLRVLGRWPDSSAKWVLLDFQANVEAGQEAVYTLHYTEGQKAAASVRGVEIAERADRFEVCTGPLRFGVGKKAFALFDGVALGQRTEASFVVAVEVMPRGGGDAWAKISESEFAGGTQRRIFGMGGRCLASAGVEEYAIEIEEAGPLRAVICCRGAYESTAPMHHYAGYRPLRFATRIYAYAGKAQVRVLHTVIATCNPRETEVEELGLRVPLSPEGRGTWRVGAGRVLAGPWVPERYALLSQRLDNHFYWEEYEGVERTVRAEGARAAGWICAENDRVGVGVALRYMAEEYPKALGVGPQGIDVFFWRDPAGRRLSFKRYAEEVAWHEGEGVYADGTGTAKSSEFFVDFFRAGAADSERLQGLLHPPQVSVEPDWVVRSGAVGGLATGAEFPRSDRMLTGFVAWMERHIERYRWKGFFDWGDVMATWEERAGGWRFKGRWGWCNSEWDPRHAVWLQYLRTGEGRYYALGEAMTRHSLDVDTCHYHPFRPYMVGGCFRHSMDHFGDEPCASHTFIDNWVDYYYLSGDERAREVLREAGEFFLRYRWSEDPRYSFSLRSIGNALRGLLYLYELTGEARFMRRAEAVYDAVARGQNQDGSWHKRFQVSTADKLPDQGPYGMATEGTTLAVEMGTAVPFSDEEFLALGGSFSSLKRVLPAAEQKGYQTHYLMVGLERLHRMTERADVAEVFVRAVDWFCGGQDAFDAEVACAQSYHGVLCGSLAYAWRLTGKRGYLEVGRAVLAELSAQQDWSDRPDYRGAVAMHPTALSLVFFGVPPLLGALAEADLEEPSC